ncbi:hypothetical protein HDZ31DRAFT_80424 [Schizophyllum fasciatum]
MTTPSMAPALFSRLQLAAALIEYDNDAEDPDAPNRSAQESAIFAHFRRTPRPAHVHRPSDYLGVPLPSDAGAPAARDSKAAELRQSIAEYRRSRGTSLDMLRNPFAQEDVPEEGSVHEPEREPEDEMDLSSWGLDSLFPKEKDRKGKGKAKAKSDTLPVQKSVQPLLSPQAQQVFPHADLPTIPRRTERSQSAGNLDELVGTVADDRRRTIAAALDYEQIVPMRRRAVSNPLEPSTSAAAAAAEPSSGLAYLDDEPGEEEPPMRIPFPAQSERSPSPMVQDRASDYFGHQRTQSAASGNLLADAERRRASSNATQALLDENNPFSLRPPSRSSRFDPKAAAHARTTSFASLGSRLPLNDADMQSVHTTGRFERERSRPLSTLELLRPKVLVMPSPLQSAALQPPAPPATRDGFMLSTDGTPLPPGARASRRASALHAFGIDPSAVPVASNSFTPNPRAHLTLSQLTFRNNLAVGGQRDVAYADIDAALPRAMQDGEQIELEDPPIIPEVQNAPSVAGSQLPGRSAGKLFGVSLIDHLEQRKAEMRSKQRVFTGDSRPTMMARGQRQRQTTLIDPNTLNLRPETQRMSSYQSAPGAMNRQSQGRPLVDMAAEGLAPTRALGQPSAVRSVFGVDTLWEREMAKVKEIEAQEKLEEEERLRKEAEEEARNPKKKKKKGKKGKKDLAPGASSLAVDDVSPAASSVALADASAAEPEVPRVSAEPPTLPDIPKAITRGPPRPANDDDNDDDESSESDEDEAPPAAGRKSEDTGWFAGASDDEGDGPRRTTGSGPRYPKRAASQPKPPPPPPAGDDSEEDLPLSATLNRAMARHTIAQALDDSEDEDKPLAAVLGKARQGASAAGTSLPALGSEGGLLSKELDGLLSPKKDGGAAGGDEEEEEDNAPLGLRASRAIPPADGGGDDDDDRPLAMHPDQQRRTQFRAAQQQNLAAQQMVFQQQQQQMMMNPLASMYFNPSMVGSGFFAPPAPAMGTGMGMGMGMGGMGGMGMGMMPMPPPQAPPSPPPVPNPAKFGLVDRWRHDVAVEGEPAT